MLFYFFLRDNSEIGSNIKTSKQVSDQLLKETRLSGRQRECWAAPLRTLLSRYINKWTKARSASGWR